MAPGTRTHYDLNELGWNNRARSLAICDWAVANRKVTTTTSTTSTPATSTTPTLTSTPSLLSTTELTSFEKEPRALPLIMEVTENSTSFEEDATEEIVVVHMPEIIEINTTETELGLPDAEYEADLGSPSPICLQNLSYPFPHEVVIKSENKTICSGSIIAPTFILTSAHCIDDVDIKDLSVTTEAFDVGINVKFAKTHESYETNGNDDIAILELANSLNYSKVNHIILPEQNEKFAGRSLVNLFDLDGGSSALCWKAEISNWILCGLRIKDGTYLDIAKYVEWVEKAEREIRENNFRKIYEAAINVHLPKVREMIQEHIEGRRAGEIPQKDDDGKNTTLEYCVGMRWANPYCWFIH